jgi:hypothetical protein
VTPRETAIGITRRYGIAIFVERHALSRRRRCSAFELVGPLTQQLRIAASGALSGSLDQHRALQQSRCDVLRLHATSQLEAP